MPLPTSPLAPSTSSSDDDARREALALMEASQSALDAIQDAGHASADLISQLQHREFGELTALYQLDSVTVDEHAFIEARAKFDALTSGGEATVFAPDDDALDELRESERREKQDEQDRLLAEARATERAERKAKREALLGKSTVALWTLSAAVILVTGGGIYTLHANGVIGGTGENRILQTPAAEVSEEPPTHVSDVRVRPSDVATADEPADSDGDSG